MKIFDRIENWQMNWQTNGSTIVTNIRRQFAGSTSKKLRLARNKARLVYFWLIVRTLRAQFAESFVIARSSFRIDCTFSCEMPTVLTSCFSVTRLPVITIPWSLLTISGVATVTCFHAWRGSSSRPCMSAASKFRHPPVYCIKLRDILS